MDLAALGPSWDWMANACIREFEAALAASGIDLLRPAREGETERAGARFFKPLRQIIESVNDTLKGQLDLEQEGGLTLAGVVVGSGSASSPSPPQSGTTTRSPPRSSDP